MNSSTDFSRNLRNEAMPALTISMEKDTYTKLRNKNSYFYKCLSDITMQSFYDDFTLKTCINLLNSTLSRTLGVMFQAKQLFTKNYLSTSFAHYALFSLF